MSVIHYFGIRRISLPGVQTNIITIIERFITIYILLNKIHFTSHGISVWDIYFRIRVGQISSL